MFFDSLGAPQRLAACAFFAPRYFAPFEGNILVPVAEHAYVKLFSFFLFKFNFCLIVISLFLFISFDSTLQYSSSFLKAVQICLF